MITKPSDVENNLRLALIAFNMDIVPYNKNAKLYFNLVDIEDSILNKVIKESNHIIFSQRLEPHHILVINSDRALKFDLNDTQASIGEQLFDFAYPDYAN